MISAFPNLPIHGTPGIRRDEWVHAQWAAHFLNMVPHDAEWDCLSGSTTSQKNKSIQVNTCKSIPIDQKLETNQRSSRFVTSRLAGSSLRSAAMRFSYEFSNLCGTVYRGGNLVFTPDGSSVFR